MKILHSNTSKQLTIFICIIIVSLLVTGCYPVHSIEKYPTKIEFYKEANSAFEGKEVEVSLMRSDSTFYAEHATINNDSTIDFKVFNGKTITLPSNEIKAVRYRNYRGIPTGFLLGVVGGIGGGAIIKNAVKQDPHPGPNQQVSTLPHNDGMDAFVISAVVGPVIGTAVGWFVGGRTTWEFNK